MAVAIPGSRYREPQMCCCTSGNLEMPGSRVARPGMTGEKAMRGLWLGKKGEQGAAVSVEFEHALNREVMRTELIRVKALIATAVILLAVLWTVDVIDPHGLDHIWRGHFRPNYLNRILVPFVLFELCLLYTSDAADDLL